MFGRGLCLGPSETKNESEARRSLCDLWRNGFVEERSEYNGWTKSGATRRHGRPISTRRGEAATYWRRGDGACERSEPHVSLDIMIGLLYETGSFFIISISGF